MDDVRVFLRPRPALGGGATALRVALGESGLSTRDMERLTGVSRSTVNNLANGKGGVDRRKAAAMAEALGRSTDDLFGVPPE